MKLISLNTWGGRAGRDVLLSFFEKHAETDIFCLQEIWDGGEEMAGEIAGGRVMHNVLTTLLPDIAATLPTHQGFFHPSFFDYYGLAVFVKRDIPVLEEGDTFVYRDHGYIADEDVGDHARNLQYVAVETPAGLRTVLNFHGMWQKNLGKSDTPARIEQAERIAAFLHSIETPRILCGDFNLTADTESMRILEREGLRNLTREHKIVSTRTSLYDKPEKANVAIDHMLVGDGITVGDFRVLPDVVSDHAPLYLEFV